MLSLASLFGPFFAIGEIVPALKDDGFVHVILHRTLNNNFVHMAMYHNGLVYHNHPEGGGHQRLSWDQYQHCFRLKRRAGKNAIVLILRERRQTEIPKIDTSAVYDLSENNCFHYVIKHYIDHQHLNPRTLDNKLYDGNFWLRLTKDPSSLRAFVSMDIQFSLAVATVVMVATAVSDKKKRKKEYESVNAQYVCVSK